MQNLKKTILNENMFYLVVVLVGILLIWNANSGSLPSPSVGAYLYLDPAQASPNAGIAPTTILQEGDETQIIRCSECPENVYLVRIFGPGRDLENNRFYWYAPESLLVDYEGQSQSNQIGTLLTPVQTFLEEVSQQYAWAYLVILIALYGWQPLISFIGARRDSEIIFNAQDPQTDPFEIDDIAAFGAEVGTVTGVLETRVVREDAQFSNAYQKLGKTERERRSEAIKLATAKIKTWLNRVITDYFEEHGDDADLDQDKLGRFLNLKAREFKKYGLVLPYTYGIKLVGVQVHGVNLSQTQQDAADLAFQSKKLTEAILQFQREGGIESFSEAAKLYADNQKSLRGLVVFPEDGILGSLAGVAGLIGASQPTNEEETS